MNNRNMCVMAIIGIIGIGCLLFVGCIRQDLSNQTTPPGVKIFTVSMMVPARTDERLQVVRFVRYGDAYIAPVLIRDQPRFFVAGVKTVQRPEPVTHYVGPGQLYVYITVESRITSYLFMLRLVNSDVWHVYELGTLPDTISFPKVATLETLKSRSDGDDLLKLYSQAKLCQAAISEREK